MLAAGGGSSSNSTPAAATASYVGSWKGNCGTSEVLTTNGGAALNEQYTFTSTASTATTVTYTVVNRFYATADTTCAFTSLGNETTIGSVVTITGTTTIGGNAVDKITIASPAITGLVMGNMNASGTNFGTGALTASNGVYFPANHFIAIASEPHLQRVTATQWFCDDGSGTPPAYPTGMDSVACATKI